MPEKQESVDRPDSHAGRIELIGALRQERERLKALGERNIFIEAHLSILEGAQALVQKPKECDEAQRNREEHARILAQAHAHIKNLRTLHLPGCIRLILAHSARHACHKDLVMRKAA